MANIQSVKLSDLKLESSVGDEGIIAHDSASGEKFTFNDMPDTADLKLSLEDNGYNPSDGNYITATTEGKVMWGGRRVWLMQSDLELAPDTMVDVEIMTEKEFKQSMIDTLGLSPAQKSEVKPRIYEAFEE